MTEHRNGGAAVVETLAAHGVDTIFGIPGTHNLELYRQLRRRPGSAPITPRHEQGAGYAADGYAAGERARPACVVTTSGPGLLNAAAAAATAYAESRPVLLLSPGMPHRHRGRDLGRLHETKDATGAMERIVAWSRRVSLARGGGRRPSPRRSRRSPAGGRGPCTSRSRSTCWSSPGPASRHRRPRTRPPRPRPPTPCAPRPTCCAAADRR